MCLYLNLESLLMAIYLNTMACHSADALFWKGQAGWPEEISSHLMLYVLEQHINLHS